jgi:hypothetical protein
MSDSLPTGYYDQGVYDTQNGNSQDALSWTGGVLTESDQVTLYNAGYNGDPRPT